MPGFPGLAIGAGLGQFAQDYRQQQQAANANMMLRLTLQRFAQEQQDRQKQQAIQGAEWSANLPGATEVGALPGGSGLPGTVSAVPPAPPAPPPMGGSRMRAGGGLSIQALTDAAIKAGFPPDKAPIMAATMMGETGGNPNAYNPNDPGGSFGVGQFNAAAHPWARETMGNLDLSMKRALELSKGGTDFSPWSVYKSGAYRSYLPTGGTGQGRTAPSIGGGASAGDVYAPQTLGDYGSDFANETLGGRPGGTPRETQIAQAGPPTATDAGLPQIGATPADPMAAKASQDLGQMLPPTVHAKMSRDALVRVISQIPGLDDAQRGQVFMHRWKDMAPQEQEYTREYLQQRGQIFSEKMADKRQEGMEARQIQREAATAAAAEQRENRKWGDPVKMEGAPGEPPRYVQVNKGTGEVREVKGVTGELTKIGTTGSGKPADKAEVDYWTKVLQAGGSLPPGLARTKTGSNVVQEIMKNMSSSGQTPGDFIAQHSAVKANTTSLTNMTKMADSAISFEKLAEKNFDVALRLAPDAVPTELGPFFNQWIERGETMIGDPNVPPYVAAMLTGANEYAKVMSGSTGTAASTNESRRQAAEMFSPYFSLPQISQVIAVAKADMKNRENSLTEQVGLIKERLGSSTPTPIAPPAAPRATGQESQNAPAAAPATGAPKYAVGQIVPAGGKQYRVIRIDPAKPDDPEIEEVK